MPLMIFDDALPNSPKILEYHDMHKLFEINRLIAIDFWQLIVYKFLISISPRNYADIIM